MSRIFVKNMRGEVLFETSQRTECAPLSVEAMEPVSLKEVIEAEETRSLWNGGIYTF